MLATVVGQTSDDQTASTTQTYPIAHDLWRESEDASSDQFQFIFHRGFLQQTVPSRQQLADLAYGDAHLYWPPQNHSTAGGSDFVARDVAVQQASHNGPILDRPPGPDGHPTSNSPHGSSNGSARSLAPSPGENIHGFSAFSNVEIATIDTAELPVAPTQNRQTSVGNAQPSPASSGLTSRTGPTADVSAINAGSVEATPTVPAFGPALPSGFSFDLPVSQQLIGELFDEIQRQKDLLSTAPETEEVDEERVRRTRLLDESHSSLVQAKNFQKKGFLQRNGIRMFESDKRVLEEKLSVVRKPLLPVGGESAEDLFARLQSYRQEMDDNNAQLHELNKTELQHKVRLGEIPKDRATARKRIGEIKKQLKNEELSGADTFVMIRLRSEELELEYRIESLDSESKLYELENRLLPLESDLLARRVKILEAEIEAWNTAANQRRRMDLEEEARQARVQVIDAAPALRALATLNAELTERRIKFTEKIRAATDEEIEVKELLNSVRSQHDTVEKSIVDNTLSQANGLLLVDVRRKMVRPFKSLQRIRAINRELQQISLDRLNLNERREPLSHPHEYAASMLEGVHSDSISDQELSNMAVEIVESIREQYDQLSAGHHMYIDLLGKIVAEREALVREIDATMEFVNQKSLWVRSAQPISIEQVAKSRHGITHFFSPQQWAELAGELLNRCTTCPHETAAGLIGLMALLTISQRFKP